MKNLLARVYKFLVIGAVTTTFSVASSFLGVFYFTRVEAQTSKRPYVVFVNGSGDCCAWEMDALREKLIQQHGLTDEDIRYTSYASFNRNVTTTTVPLVGLSLNLDKNFLKEGAEFINKELEPNRPLILIGHSYGGDSILKLLPRIKRSILFVGVIDPVATAGFRWPIKLYIVPSNVRYFYNRWQQNPRLAHGQFNPFPIDRINGRISCKAAQCDQDAQNIARNEDGSPIKDNCKSYASLCPGSNILKRRKGSIQRRLAHDVMPYDKYIQTQIAKKIEELLNQQEAELKQQEVNKLIQASFRSPYFRNGRWMPGLYSNIGMSPRGVVFVWSNPWDRGKTDTWCNVPAPHSNVLIALEAVKKYGVNRDKTYEIPTILAITEDKSKRVTYWSQPCTPDVYEQLKTEPRISKQPDTNDTKPLEPPIVPEPPIVVQEPRISKQSDTNDTKSTGSSDSKIGTGNGNLVRCENLKTVGIKDNQKFPIIQWKTNRFGKIYSPQARCNFVSQKLNDIVKVNGDRFDGLRLTQGSINNRVVVCVLKSNEIECNPRNVLFTLHRKNERQVGRIIGKLHNVNILDADLIVE